MTAKAAQGKREDRREDAGFKEEDQAEHGDADVAGCADGSGDEGHDARHVCEKDMAGANVFHKESGGETPNGKEGLGDCKQIGAFRRGKRGLDLDAVVDEVARNSHLRAHVAELGGSSPEESVLAAQRLVLVSG